MTSEYEYSLLQFDQKDWAAKCNVLGIFFAYICLIRWIIKALKLLFGIQTVTLLQRHMWPQTKMFTISEFSGTAFHVPSHGVISYVPTVTSFRDHSLTSRNIPTAILFEWFSS